MHEVTEPLYFVIDEKLNSVDLTDKGIDLITGTSEDPTLFVLPDIAAELSELENMNLTNEQLDVYKRQIHIQFRSQGDIVYSLDTQSFISRRYLRTFSQEFILSLIHI